MRRCALPLLSLVSKSRISFSRRFNASEPPSTLAVLVPQEPEFEGDVTSGSDSAAAVGNTPGAATAPAASPQPVVYDNAAPLCNPPELKMGIQRPCSISDVSEVDRIVEAYLSFFQHIRFRNGWAEPPFKEEAIRPLFQEAADVVVRIRKYLDEKDATTKLRRVDGEAQTFLHAPGTPSLFERNQRAFVVALVHATFRDAVGYVEGLSNATIDAFIAEIFQYQYNPRVHAAHQVAWMQRALRDQLRLEVEKPSDEVVSWDAKDALGRTSAFYCSSTEEEKEWRAVINKLRDAMDSVSDMVERQQQKSDGRGK